MERLPSAPLTLTLALLLAACSPFASSPAEGAPVAPVQVAAQENFPTAATEVPAIQSTIIAADSAVVSSDPPNICPVTLPPEPKFVPPAPHSRYAPGGFWYGTDSLWTAIPGDGVWSALPHNPEGYTQKVFWWREGYSWTDEPEPELFVSGQRLDAPAPPLNVSRATNAYASDIGSAMLVGVDFPTLGCWEITGRYGEAELSFVVWVAP